VEKVEIQGSISWKNIFIPENKGGKKLRNWTFLKKATYDDTQAFRTRKRWGLTCKEEERNGNGNREKIQRKQGDVTHWWEHARKSKRMHKKVPDLRHLREGGKKDKFFINL